MKHILKTSFFFAITVAGILFTGCKKEVMDVPNENDPDFKKVYSNGEDIQNVASGLFNTLFNGEHSYSGVEMMLAVAADNVSCSWGNAGMRDMSYEPRDNAWINTPAYGNNGFTKYTYDKCYSAINTASNVIKAINGGVNIGDNGADNNRSLAVARFIQGVAYGNLALVFDRAHVVDESKTVEGVLSTALPFNEVADAAVAYLDEAISLAGSGFTIPADWFGAASDISSADFIKMANTAAARILAYTPRNKTQLAAVNWAKVKTYADNGITQDWEVVMDAYTNWYFEAGDYLTFPGWGITDMYTVNMLDHTQPQHWDNSASFPYPPPSTSPDDERMNTDFEYVSSNWLLASRGYYHFSNYRFKRYDDIYLNGVGPKAEVMKAENDMLRAEARAYTGDLSGAAAIINAGTRTTRGNMPNVAANLTEIVNAIHHERFVEMYTTGMGLQFFEMRKLDLLQKGTPLQLPLPAKTMELFGEKQPFYSFGTTAKADGIGTSNGGWR